MGTLFILRHGGGIMLGLSILEGRCTTLKMRIPRTYWNTTLDGVSTFSKMEEIHVRRILVNLGNVDTVESRINGGLSYRTAKRFFPLDRASTRGPDEWRYLDLSLMITD